MIFTIRKSSNYAVIRELAEYLQHQTFVYRAVGEILSSTEGQRTVQNMTNQNLRRMPPYQTAPHRTAPHHTVPPRAGLHHRASPTYTLFAMSYINIVLNIIPTLMRVT